MPERRLGEHPVRSLRLITVIAMLWAMAGLVAAALPAHGALRFKSTGQYTLGGADSLAELKDACEIADHHVWVQVDGRGDCIAFHPTAGLSGAKQAVFYFEGDIPASYRHNRRGLSRHLASLRRTLDGLARTYNVPYVLVARPGTFGSTGSHEDRRKVREYQLMRQAIEGIRTRFEIGEVSLAGQSGGATIAGALLTLGLTGVRCVAPASGGFDLSAMLDWHASRRGYPPTHRELPASISESLSVMDRLGNVRVEARRRIFVIGDKDDKVTPFDQQRRFAEALKEAGHHAELVEAEASGPEQHGLALTALRVVGLCASGASDVDIRTFVSPRKPAN